MKIHIFAIVIAVSVICVVFVNSFVIGYNIERLTEAISAAPEDEPCAEIYDGLFEDYLRREKYLALSISHSDLLGVEDALSELVGAASAEDYDSVKMAKSRVIQALTHIKRLSGVNLDSIF